MMLVLYMNLIEWQFANCIQIYHIVNTNLLTTTHVNPTIIETLTNPIQNMLNSFLNWKLYKYCQRASALMH